MSEAFFNGWKDGLTELIRRAATDLPGDVEDAMRRALAHEEAGSRAAFMLDSLLQNVALARQENLPMCQDTGTLTFWFDVPPGTDTVPLTGATRAAVAAATERGWLRQNTILEPAGKSAPDNLAEHHPVIYFRQQPRADVRVQLLLKGGGCENVSHQYSLPDEDIGAGRNLEGVRRCIIDAVWRAQGRGCAPGILGVCVGGDRATGYALAKDQLLRPLGQPSPIAEYARLEEEVLAEVQNLGIGPMGMGGASTLLGIRIGTASRLPASYFVTIAYMCWACRRATLTR